MKGRNVVLEWNVHIHGHHGASAFMTTTQLSFCINGGLCTSCHCQDILLVPCAGDITHSKHPGCEGGHGPHPIIPFYHYERYLLWFTMTFLTSAVQSKSFYNYFYAIERCIILSSKMKISLPLTRSMSSVSAFAPAASKCTIVSSEHTALCATKSNKEDLELMRQVIAKFVEDIGGDAVDMTAPPAPVPVPPAPTPMSAVVAAPATEPEETPKTKKEAAKKKSATKKTATKKKKKKKRA